jgi:hypothetical protein
MASHEDRTTFWSTFYLRNYVPLCAWVTHLRCAAILNLPGYCRNLGHRDALHSWRHRDEDTFKAPGEGAGLIFTAAHRQTGEGRPIPQAGTARPEQSGMG